jgi:hypothetical protein
MARIAHRTRVARLVAVFLVALAVSPFAAPFTTVSLCELHHSPGDGGHRHVGADAAVAQTKLVTHLTLVPLTPPVALLLPGLARSASAPPTAADRSTVPHGGPLVLRV